MPKLIDYKCPQCGHTDEGFDDEGMLCEECILLHEDSLNEGICEDCEFCMVPMFSPKNNQQRARINDK